MERTTATTPRTAEGSPPTRPIARKVGVAVCVAALALLSVPLQPGSALADDGEIWVTAQDSSQLKIMHGLGSVETVALPTTAKPHSIDFAPSGEYAYVADVGDGDVQVIRAADRQVVATLDLGAAGTHQAKPSPTGTTLLVAQMPTKTLIKVAADETDESWSVTGSLSFESLGKAPVCTAFRADGQRAYVSLSGSGIAVVDVATMTLLGTLATAGAAQCGLVNSRDGHTIFVDSNGGGGHFYRLDTTTDTLTDGGYAIEGVDLHAFGMLPNETWAFAASRGNDQLTMIHLAMPEMTAWSVSLDLRPGVADKPDMVAMKGGSVYVTLRAAGCIAIIKPNQQTVRYVPLVDPSANAVHGIAVRP